MASPSLILLIADAANAVAASPATHEAAQGIHGPPGLSILAIILWAGLVIFARHRVGN